MLAPGRARRIAPSLPGQGPPASVAWTLKALVLWALALALVTLVLLTLAWGPQWLGNAMTRTELTDEGRELFLRIHAAMQRPLVRDGRITGIGQGPPWPSEGPVVIRRGVPCP